MTTATVRSQEDLDHAVADATVTAIFVQSDNDAWLSVTSPCPAIVVQGSSAVMAYGHARIEALDSARIEAHDSVTVFAHDSVTVFARESSTVEAHRTATVRAYQRAAVTAFDSARVKAFDTVAVRAYDFSTVDAWDAATVTAFGSSTVHAKGYATVIAGPHVAVHLRSDRAVVTGGVVIDLRAVDLADSRAWAEHHGVQIKQAADLTCAVLYKAVDADLTAGRNYKPTVYGVGDTVTCGDWRDDRQCGGGLHVSPRPDQARCYSPCADDEVRFLRVLVDLDVLRPIDDTKCKAPYVMVEAEVDSLGRELAPAATA